MTDKFVKQGGILVPVTSVDRTARQLRHLRGEADDEYQARKNLLDSTAPDQTRAGSDAALDSHQRTVASKPNDSFDKKVYFFPESFNALRRELQENWREFFEEVNPLTGTSPAYCMVFDAPQFIGYCNGFTGLTVQFDSESVDAICQTFLNKFRNMRGVSSL